MRWDRTAWISALFYVAAVAVVSALALTDTVETWRFELGRASDVAGEYLFICSPILCGIVALNARRVANVSRGFAAGSRNPKAGAYRVWWRFAAVALIAHMMVLACAIVVVLRSDAASTLSAQPFVRQVGLIVFAAATGALLGARIRSIAFPAVVFLMGVLIALLVPQSHLRPLLLAGSGTFDFAFKQYSLSLLLLTVALAASVVLLAWWGTSISRAALVGLRALGVLVGAFALVLQTNDQTFALQWVGRAPLCVEQTPQVCAPPELVRANTEVADIASGIYDRATPVVAKHLPRKLELVGPGAYGQRFGSIEFETAQLANYHQVFYATASALAGANLCVDVLPGDKVEAQILASAIIVGWFEKNAGIDLPGSYPAAEEERLRALPVDQQRRTVARLLEEIRGCQGVNIEALR